MSPREVVEYMLAQDGYSQWLGIRLIDVKEDYCLIEMTVRKDMLNGLKSTHGGVTFGLADSAFAFSSNNNGDAAVALTCSINYLKAGREGDVFRAESKLVNKTRKTAVYDINITNQDQEPVAKFVGTVYKIGKKVTEL